MSVGDRGLAERLVAELGRGQVVQSCGQFTAEVPLTDWTGAAELARDALRCGLFDHLSVHDHGHPAEAGLEWEVIAHVVALPGCTGLLLSTTLPAGGVLPSITGVWAGAAWHEREAAEMAGIEVSGHPDLRPLLLAAGTGLHPLRKDTVLVSRAVRPWPGRMEPGESAEQPGAGRRRASTPGLPPEGWAQP